MANLKTVKPSKQKIPEQISASQKDQGKDKDNFSGTKV
jgi:hypothetical protein